MVLTCLNEPFAFAANIGDLTGRVPSGLLPHGSAEILQGAAFWKFEDVPREGKYHGVSRKPWRKHAVKKL